MALTVWSIRHLLVQGSVHVAHSPREVDRLRHALQVGPLCQSALEQAQQNVGGQGALVGLVEEQLTNYVKAGIIGDVSLKSFNKFVRGVFAAYNASNTVIDP